MSYSIVQNLEARLAKAERQVEELTNLLEHERSRRKSAESAAVAAAHMLHAAGLSAGLIERATGIDVTKGTEIE